MDDVDVEYMDDEYGHENTINLDNVSYFKNLKIGDYDLAQIDELVNEGERDLEQNISMSYNSHLDQTPRNRAIKEELMKLEEDEMAKEKEIMDNIISDSKQSMIKFL